MNWYKKAQNQDEFEATPEWEYPGAEHDYNPSWDYDVDPNPDQAIVQFINNYLQKIKQELLPEIGFIQDIKPAFIRNESGILGRYIFGTQPWAVIVINIEACRKGAKKYKVNFEQQLEVTILHELAHAIQEGINIDMDERQAEEFARSYVVYKTVDNFWDNI